MFKITYNYSDMNKPATQFVKAYSADKAADIQFGCTANEAIELGLCKSIEQH